MAESKFSSWQNRLTTVRVLDKRGKMVDYEFRRIMIDYANALMELESEKDAQAATGCNEYDVKNWIAGYEGYKEYLQLRSEARLFSNSIDKDFLYSILGKAALGERELNAAQVAAIKLLMQGEAMISANGSHRNKDSEGGKQIETI